MNVKKTPAPSNTASTEAPRTSPTLRILKKALCGLIAPSSSGRLTYHIGYSDKDKTFHIRVTGNTGGGYFSKEWVSLDRIQECIEAQPPGQPFKSLVLRKLYKSTGANNYGFLAAALRAEGILLPVPKAPFSHLPGDVSAFQRPMQSALKAKTDLEDEVAIEEAEKDKARQQRAAAMQSSSKAKGKTPPMQPEVSSPPVDAPMQTASAKASVSVAKVKPPRKITAKAAH